LRNFPHRSAGKTAFFPKWAIERLAKTVVCYAGGMQVEQNNKSDEEVWRQFTSGSNDALTSLFNKYNGRFMAFLITRKCKDPETICQEAWSRIIEKRDSFDGRSFSGWAFTIVRNLYAEQVRKSVARDEKQLMPDADGGTDDHLFGLAKLEAKERIDVLKSCMEAVGEPFLTVFRMKTFQNCKAKQIAEAIGIAENTVHTRVSRAKQKIKDCVEAKLS